MLSVPSNCGSSSLPNWIGILPLRPIRRVVDALVPPVPGVQSALRYLLFLGARAIWQMLGHWLNSSLIQLLAHASLSVCCHEVVSFYYCWVHNCTELVLIGWVSLETAVVSGVLRGMLRGLGLIVATLRRVHVHGTPGSVLVCTILVLLSAASFVIHHLRRSHGRSSSCGCVLARAMASNHLVLRVLRRSMRAIGCLQSLVSVCKGTVAHSHIHATMHVLLCLLGQLRLVSHVMASTLSKASCHLHQLGLMSSRIYMSILAGVIAVVVMCWRVS